MHKIKNILFDFDGVLVDSLEIKTKAFVEMYLSYGQEAADWVRKHHLDNGGVSRFEKFKIYQEKFTGKIPEPDTLNQLLDEFALRVKKAVIDCDEVPGAEKFLQRYHQEVNLYIITGTPTEEINEILKGRGWTDYFKGIMGSPEKKTYWVHQLQKEVNMDADTAIFVGDALADHEAAVSGALPFYLREHPENIALFNEITCPRFNTFNEFEKLLHTNGLI